MSLKLKIQRVYTVGSSNLLGVGAFNSESTAGVSQSVKGLVKGSVSQPVSQSVNLGIAFILLGTSCTHIDLVPPGGASVSQQQP